MLSYIPGLHPVDTSNLPIPVVTTKNVSRRCQTSSGGQNPIPLRTGDLERGEGLITYRQNHEECDRCYERNRALRKRVLKAPEKLGVGWGDLQQAGCPRSCWKSMPGRGSQMCKGLVVLEELPPRQGLAPSGDLHLTTLLPLTSAWPTWATHSTGC